VVARVGAVAEAAGVAVIQVAVLEALGVAISVAVVLAGIIRNSTKIIPSFSES
jgi:hypothetical protein